MARRLRFRIHQAICRLILICVYLGTSGPSICIRLPPWPIQILTKSKIQYAPVRRLLTKIRRLRESLRNMWDADFLALQLEECFVLLLLIY